MTNNIKNKKKVFVGMSGGVDSSVSAALLKEQGFEVVGVFIKTWHPDFISCNEEEERHDAMRVAAHLDIPFLTFDFEDVYKKEVADYMIRGYKRGKTPNPDVMCNKHVKFGAFYKKAIGMGADYVATGHYAQNKNISLIKGKDPSKDQSYFLWTLKQGQLSKILFPIGHLDKIEVRKLAKKFKIPVAEKKDSQGICFLGAVDLKDFLKHYIKENKGKVLNTNGQEIGHHNGAVFLTLGERHGFTVAKKGPNDGPYYIISKDVKKNILYVSQDKNFISQKKNQKDLGAFAFGHKKILESKGIHDASNLSDSSFANARSSLGGFILKLQDVNWISGIPKDYQLSTKNYTCQIRYHGEFLVCKIKNIKKNSVEVVFSKPILVDSGQSCVLYDKDVILGGGVIK
jgi:tRNA-specific 2-thiouridylase